MKIILLETMSIPVELRRTIYIIRSMFHYYTRTKESRKVRNTRMLDLKLINKVNEVEKQTGQIVTQSII